MEQHPENTGSVTNKIRTYVRQHWPALVGILAGTAGGYLYYRLVGCSTGSCPITSNPWISTFWGAGLGYLIGDIFKIKPFKTRQHEKEYGND